MIVLEARGRAAVLSPLGSLLDDIRRERHVSVRVPPPAWAQAEPELPGDVPLGAATPASPFGFLLEQLRQRPRSRAERAPSPPRGRQLARADLELDLQLETRVVTAAPRPSQRRISWLLAASFVLHVAVALTVAVLRLLLPEPLPGPASDIKAFLVEPVMVTPPPPPPPPGPKRVVPNRVAVPSPGPKLFAPPGAPDRVVPDERAGLDVDTGEVGGVEGGLPGGVVGGIVGGLPAAPAPLPAPVRLEKGVKEPRKLKHVAPRYPEIAARANLRGSVLLECLVSPEGRVTEVKVLRSANPLFVEPAVEAVKQWTYTPTLVDGVPVAVIFTVTVVFQLY